MENNSLCIDLWFGFQVPLHERLNMIKSVGFEEIMVWWDKLLYDDRQNKGHFLKTIHDSGIKINNIHVPFNNIDDIWLGDKELANAVVNQYYKWIDDCKENNIPMIVTHITKGTFIKEPNMEGINCISQIIERAEQYNIKIALENTKDPDFISVVLDEIPSKHLGYCYDSSHDWLYSESKYQVLIKNGHRLFFTHFCDCDGIKDSHLIPRQGVIDWNSVFEVFPKDYFGSISIEARSANDKINLTPEDFLTDAYNTAGWIRSNVSKTYDKFHQKDTILRLF